MMTVTAAAAACIRESLRRSEIPIPVVVLVPAREYPKEVQHALNRGLSQQEVQCILSGVGPSRWYLYPFVYPRSRYLWLTNRIDGIPFSPLFACSPNIRRAMKRGVLDVAERGLVLKNVDGTVVSPINE